MSDLNYVIGDYGRTTAATTYPTTIQSATITTSGFPVQITVTGDGEPNAGGWQRIQIYRDATPISEILHVETTGAGKNVTLAMVHIDTPTAGTYDYSVRVVNGSGLSITYTETGQLSMIVEEKISNGGNLSNNWLRRDIGSPDVYYGYSSDYNATDSETKWSIKKVSVSGSVETVTWSNGSPSSRASIWDERVDCFISPSGPINLTGTVSSFGNDILLGVNWSILSGVDRYQILVKDEDTGVKFTDDGFILYNTGANSQITQELFHTDNYTYIHADLGKTYSITVTAINVAGNYDETVILYT